MHRETVKEIKRKANFKVHKHNHNKTLHVGRREGET